MEFTDQAIAQQVQVTDGIQDLVFDELVLVAQAVLVEHALLVHHDGVLDAAAQGQVVGAQEFDVAHETEGAGATDFLDERGTGEIHAGGLGPAVEDRVVEIDLEADLEAVEGPEGGTLVAIDDRDFALDADELLRRVLLLQAGRLDQEHEGTGAAIHDRHFRRGQFDDGIVDAQTGQGRKQVLDGIHLDAAVIERGGHGGLANILGGRLDFHDRIEVDTAEHDAGVRRRGLQGQVNLFPRVQANASGTDDVF